MTNSRLDVKEATPGVDRSKRNGNQLLAQALRDMIPKNCFVQNDFWCYS